MHKVLGDKRAVFLLLGPALLVYTLIMVVPIVWSMFYTVQDGNPIVGFTFVGFDNFAKFFQDPAAWDALLFTLKYALVLTVLQVGFGYLLSLMYVFWLRRGSSAIRTIVFFPVVLPTVAVALLFQRLFEAAPTTGPVNALLNAFGLDSIDWFGTPGAAFWIIILMDLWRSMGFYAVLLYAGLVDIPDDILESARLDGAAGWKLVRTIVLPLSLPVLLSSLIFSINGTLKVFDTVVALTNGGPGSATTPLTLYMFRTSFSYGDFGYGSTIALMLTVLCLLFTLFIFRSTRRDLTKD
ncbi:carbohydrate ABC transporter permease [Microbacterium terricola]|uniref:ABC transporter permease n=1 Tax=Microbacterium terricola TaxID=344163 RepID=A0ABM8E1P7_9MICO|nr:sugar ABC transporter permease [Microbacterium terricola]UYK40408.1 sugar ABC transporter permease [Microbacterium terricola]BDV31874.1 ABC transporter permease [Microbacterium terricola]